MSSPQGQQRGSSGKLENQASQEKRELRERWEPTQGHREPGEGGPRYSKGKIRLLRMKSLLLLFLLNAVTLTPRHAHTVCITSPMMTEQAVTTTFELKVFMNGMNTVTKSPGESVTHSVNPGQLSCRKDLHVPFYQIKGKTEHTVFQAHFCLGYQETQLHLELSCNPKCWTPCILKTAISVF